MKVIVAPDKFKGSLSAPDAAEAIARGVRRADRHATIDLVPMADGGDGTVEALVEATGGSYQTASVAGPLGDLVPSARFGVLGDGRTVVLEMASASGLVLVPTGHRDVMAASTLGTGELILAALKSNPCRLIVAIGGSATNDGGAGMAVALGFELLDAEGRTLPPGGGSLGRLDRIIPPAADSLAGVEVLVACDVANPLCGPTGASRVYGPQKGATPDQVEVLDGNLAHFAAIVRRDLGIDVLDRPGSGAAGGLGAGLMAFAGGKLVPGVTLVEQAVSLAGRLQGADLCLTAEGAIDASSAFGKTAVGVARLARKAGVPTLALAGSIGSGAEDVHPEGIDAYFTICPGPVPLDHAIANAASLLEAAAEQAVRAFLAGRRALPSREFEHGQG
jgi:glycerate kinase